MTQAITQIPEHENEEGIVLSLDAFFRSIGVRRTTPVTSRTSSPGTLRRRGPDMIERVDTERLVD